MIFLVRVPPGTGAPTGVDVKLSRPTPPYADAGGGTDHFCVGSRDVAEGLVAEGLRVVALADGWYEAGTGGVAVWGKAERWDIRDTPFTVVEALR